MGAATKIAILGAGLIGGSLLRAVKAKGLGGAISVYDRDGSVAPDGVAVTASPSEAARGADLVFLCVPIDHMRAVAEAALPGLSPSAIVTDVGSVKGSVCAELDPLLQNRARFVGGHPMAGKEKGGFDASCDDLFAGATVILTPTAFTDAAALAAVYEFWEKLGAKIEQMSPAEHDRRVARISHLPHLAAAALASVPDDDAMKVAGPGFRDATRIAGGPADLWTGILSANRAETARALDDLLARLQEARAALEPGNERQLHDFLDRANQMRNKLG